MDFLLLLFIFELNATASIFLDVVCFMYWVIPGDLLFESRDA